MGALALRVTGASKSYARHGRLEPVLAGVDLELRAGEVFVLLGPSGCGKSTLLRALAGLEPLSAGQALLGTGQRVGIAFQDPLLLPWLTLAENVSLGLRYARNRTSDGALRVTTVLREFGLAEVAASYPHELSGGQAQRASLARTIIPQPTTLLLDEPFAALDPRTRVDLQGWLRTLKHRFGLTILLVTHDLDEALALGDRVGLLSARPGRLLRVWSAGDSAARSEILAHYQSAAAVTSPRYHPSLEQGASNGTSVARARELVATPLS